MQKGAWAHGGPASQIWSFAGSSGRSEVGSTFSQPFVSYTTPTAWTHSRQTESAYNWKSNDWWVLIAAAVSKLTALAQQPVSLQFGTRYWASTPDTGPDGLAARVAKIFLFPRKQANAADSAGGRDATAARRGA